LTPLVAITGNPGLQETSSTDGLILTYVHFGKEVFHFVTEIGNTRHNRRNLVIIIALIAFIVIGATRMKATSNPSRLRHQIEEEMSAVSWQSGLPDSVENNGISITSCPASPDIPGSDALDKLRSLRSPALEREILDIAKASVAEVVQNKRTERKYEDSAQPGSSPLQKIQAGVFVTLIIGGKVMGCMGRIYPVEPNLQQEIARAAEMAATMDIRHPPISREDLPNLDFCVSVVGRVRRESPDVEVNPRLEGILVKTGGISGVILPGEAKTAAYQRKWALREAGINPGVPFELYVFETERFGKTLPVRG
jgi:AMMECR1 domain-containing protein